VLILLLGGCGTGTSSQQPDPSTTGTGSATGQQEDLPTPSPGPIKGGRTVTVSGTVEAGVEAGCLLLKGYLLLGGPRDVLAAGRSVSVTGRVVTGTLTTCQQGTPLHVDSVRPQARRS
jgi:hypothetical protein